MTVSVALLHCSATHIIALRKCTTWTSNARKLKAKMMRKCCKIVYIF